jgi:hypothetical protein
MPVGNITADGKALPAAFSISFCSESIWSQEKQPQQYYPFCRISNAVWRPIPTRSGNNGHFLCKAFL